MVRRKVPVPRGTTRGMKELISVSDDKTVSAQNDDKESMEKEVVKHRMGRKKTRASKRSGSIGSKRTTRQSKAPLQPEVEQTVELEEEEGDGAEATSKIHSKPSQESESKDKTETVMEESNKDPASSTAPARDNVSENQTVSNKTETETEQEVEMQKEQRTKEKMEKGKAPVQGEHSMVQHTRTKKRAIRSVPVPVLGKRKKEHVSSDEETDSAESDVPPTAFSTRTLIKGKTLLTDQFRKYHCEALIELIDKQGWSRLFLDADVWYNEKWVREFYSNASYRTDLVGSEVAKQSVYLEAENLADALEIPYGGFDHYIKGKWPELDKGTTALGITRKYSQKPHLKKARKVNKLEMKPLHRMLFSFVINNVVPRSERRNDVSFLDMTLMDLMEKGKQINLASIIVQHMGKIITVTKNANSLGYGFIITAFLRYLGLSDSKTIQGDKDAWGRKFMRDNGIQIDATGQGPATRKPGVPPGGSSVPANVQVDTLQRDILAIQADLNLLRTEQAELKQIILANHQELLAALIQETETNSASSDP